LIRNSVLVGTTQPDNPYATNAGPFNNIKLSCDNASTPPLFSYCINRSEGISMPLDSFFVNQRFFNIYDGPAYQDSNAYLDITKTICPTPTNSGQGDCMYGSGLALGVRRDPADGSCYLPNAAIAWKQPNGFLYPPAFHSTNLFFGGVDIRHYVIDPLFQAPSMLKPPLDFGQGGTYLTDVFAASDGPNAAYCANKGNTGFFDGFTGIDRQTELNDDDGSLTGLSNSLMNPPNPTLKQTISVNEDTFFDAPVETAECESNLRVYAANACSSTPPNPATAPVTAKTSPYDYVLTVVAPGCSQNPPPTVPGGEPAPFGRCGDQASNPFGGQGGSHWSSDCTNQACYGVPLYRQLLAGDHNPTTDPNDPSKWTGEWQHWHNNGCDANGPTNPPPATPQCRWPFIRMAGANIYQRNTLTINHGVYYLETTVPLDAQEPGGENFSDKNNDLGTHNVNVFERPGTGSDGININGAYYVFFLYAKNSTTQTYQIYVGPEAQCNSVMSTLKAVHGNLDTGPIIFGAAPSGPTWFTAHCNQDGKGILTVTIDFQLVDDLTPSPDHGLCKPQQFCCPVGKPGCQANPGKSCGCVLAEDDPLVQANSNAGQVINECKAVCGEWAVKDLDCPEAGCYGFAFRLPDSFVADGVQTHRPPPQVVEQISDPAHLPDWTTEFLRTTTAPDASMGSCFYPDPLPGNPGCPVHQ
jgi:cell migration-inducing and hyaluronan-binding protein